MAKQRIFVPVLSPVDAKAPEGSDGKDEFKPVLAADETPAPAPAEEDEQAVAARLSAERVGAAQKARQDALNGTPTGYHADVEAAGGEAQLMAKTRVDLRKKELGIPAEAVEVEPGRWSWSERDIEQTATDPEVYQGPEVASDQPLGDKLVRGTMRGVVDASKQTAKLAGNLAGAVLPGMDAAEGGQIVEEAFGDLGKPQSVAEGLAQGIAQFTTGFVGAGRLLKAANVLQGGGAVATVARASLQGAITDAAVFDPLEGRLSNLVEEHPSLHNPITAFMAAKPDDTQAEGRLKNALEGLVLGNAVEGVLRVVRGIKRVWVAKATKGNAEAFKELDQALDEIESAGEPKAPAGDPVAVEAPKAPEAPEGTPKAADGVEAPKPALDQAEVDDVIGSLKEDFDPTNPTNAFNHEKIATSGGARQMIEAVAEKLSTKIVGKVGSEQTWNMTLKLADDLGQSPEEAMMGLRGLAQNAEKQAAIVLTARRMVSALGKQAEAEAIKVSHGLVKDRTKLNAIIQEMAAVQEMLLPVRKAQARGTRQWGIVADDLMSNQNIQAIIASGGDAKAIRKIMEKKSWMTKGVEFMNEYRINAMLSNPATHQVNLISNTAMTAARPLERALGGDVVGGMAEYMGLMHGTWDAIQMGAKAIKMEESILDPGVLKQETARFATSASALGLNPNSIMGEAVDTLGKTIRIPTRLLVGEDEVFKQLNYRAHAMATIVGEAAEKGLKMSEYGEYITKRLEEFYDSGGKAINMESLREARVAVFQEDLAGFAAKSAEFLNSHPFMRFIAPFVKTPINILKQGAYRTPPVALLMSSFRAELKAGGGRAARARGQLVLGSALWMGAIGLAYNGQLTGRGPSEKSKRDVLLASGWQPYSYKAADGKYYSYERLDPFGMILGMTADFAEMSAHMKAEDIQTFATMTTAAMARNVASKTYLRGVTDVLGSLISGDPDKAQKFFNSAAASFVPSGLGPISRIGGSGDEVMREARTMLDAMRAKIPGLSDDLPPRRDYLGEPVHYPAGWGPDSISAIKMSTQVSDPVKEELARLEIGIGMPAEKIGPQGRINLRAFKGRGGQDAYDRMLELRQTHREGRYTLHETLENLINSDYYKSLPDSSGPYNSQKMALIQDVFGDFQGAIERKVYKLPDSEFPELHEAYMADEQNKRSMKMPSGGNPIEDLLKPLTAP